MRNFHVSDEKQVKVSRIIIGEGNHKQKHHGKIFNTDVGGKRISVQSDLKE